MMRHFFKSAAKLLLIFELCKDFSEKNAFLKLFLDKSGQIWTVGRLAVYIVLRLS